MDDSRLATETTARSRVGLVVDVQNDFMLPAAPGGRLYVRDLGDDADPGAERIVPRLRTLVAWMRSHCETIIYTADWHAMGDREIDAVAPDPARETYPPHCMGLSEDPDERRGAEIITDVAPGPDVLVLGRDAEPAEARELARRAVTEGAPLLIRKREFSIFTGNASTDPLLRALEAALGSPPEFVVCGVAADVCVRHAVDGLLERGHAVTVVRDATWGLGLLGPEQTFDAWASRGARIVDTAALVGRTASQPERRGAVILGPRSGRHGP